MKRTTIGLLLGLGLTLCAGILAGCFLGGGEYACLQDDPKACTEFTGTVYTKSMVEDSCDYKVVKGCPTKDLVGKCHMNATGLNDFVIFYYSPADTEDSARQTCNDAFGDFEAP